MEVLKAPRAGKKHGEIMPLEAEPREAPALPIVLRGNLFLNLPFEEAAERYGVWNCKVLKRCKVWGRTLEPEDTADLTGDVVQQLVLQGCVSVTDKRAKEEAEIIDRATAIGMPQKIREIVAFAPRKKDKFVRPNENPS